jgi:hypothetical protein
MTGIAWEEQGLWPDMHNDSTGMEVWPYVIGVRWAELGWKYVAMSTLDILDSICCWRRRVAWAESVLLCARCKGLRQGGTLVSSGRHYRKRLTVLYNCRNATSLGDGTTQLGLLDFVDRRINQTFLGE